MKHFDIDGYAKKTLGDNSLPPSENTWYRISGLLKQKENSGKKRSAVIKVAVLIWALFLVTDTVRERGDTLPANTLRTDKVMMNLDIPIVAVAAPIRDLGVQDLSASIDSAALLAHVKRKTKGSMAKDKVGTNTKKGKGETRMPKTRIAHTSYFETPVMETEARVSDSEIDILMAQAGQNIVREKVLRRLRMAYMQKTGVGETIRTPSEVMPWHKTLEQGFIKIKEVIAN